ncbi:MULTISPECIES: flavin reductase family protein [Amycolatopsis]|uniref:NADH-FMN oxidoreductase RutF, flavin reductase (DIM6/NTAB) family n=2 Tax=Amycolatopsis TaxID=1813 RepID=A0A1I3Y5V6_9PSEU|nr:flavin reductase family protein [Amycolatopsis sacchari]SFK27152.1 NADH-FMN oxidoreductase RutF, flavin reductase (DIM6/NTAB) family [Amycolatopsis sacchari]
MEQSTLRAAFACFPSGVTALCALVDGAPDGMAVSAFTPVSLDPPLLAVCIQGGSKTWRRLRTAPAIGVTVLAAGHDALCRRLSAPADRFAGVPWTASPTGAVFVDGSPARFDCVLHEELPAGDHLIALLRIHALEFSSAGAPLVFHGSAFRQLA